MCRPRMVRRNNARRPPTEQVAAESRVPTTSRRCSTYLQRYGERSCQPFEHLSIAANALVSVPWPAVKLAPVTCEAQGCIIEPQNVTLALIRADCGQLDLDVGRDVNDLIHGGQGRPDLKHQDHWSRPDRHQACANEPCRSPMVRMRLDLIGHVDRTRAIALNGCCQSFSKSPVRSQGAVR